MDKTLYLMRGIPGSGKSTVAEAMHDALGGIICSTDELWYDEFGVYNWKAEEAGAKHRQNQQNVAYHMTEEQPVIIVDNTNINQIDVEPYLALAKIFEYTVQVVQIDTPLDVCKARQLHRSSDRAITNSVIEDMDYKLRDRPRLSI